MKQDLYTHRSCLIVPSLRQDTMDHFVMQHILHQDLEIEKTYQMDPANGQEALREIGEDIEEGADLIIAKPALAYMDIMKEASMKYNIPIVAYNVSGEYAMVKAAAANGWIDEKKIVMENMVGLKRAGAKMIITYHALDVAKWLKEEER